MIKALLLVNAFLLIILIVIPVRGAVIGQNECLYENEIWGSESDGTKFYFCHTNPNIIEQPCPEGTFFVKTDVASGCIPHNQLHTICNHPSNVVPCSEANLLQPQIGANPSEIYICLAVDEQPTKVTCAAGKAFANHNGISACYPLAQWRAITGCTAL